MNDFKLSNKSTFPPSSLLVNDLVHKNLVQIYFIDLLKHVTDEYKFHEKVIC